MSKRPFTLFLLLIAAILMFPAGNAFALTFSDFAIYAETNVSVASGGNIDGKVGATGSVFYPFGNVTSDDVYAGSNFSGGTGGSVVNGKTVANGQVTGTGVNFGGDINAGTTINVSGATVTGSTTAGGATILNNSSTVQQNLSTGANLTALANANIQGNAEVGGLTIMTGASTIQGNLNVAGGPPILVGGSQVVGTTTVGPIPPVTPESFTPLSLPAATPFAAGGANVVKAAGQTTTLAPGSYGTLSLGTNNVLNLASGQYFFNNWFANASLDLNLDVTAGDIEIFVTNNMGFVSDLDMILTGGTAANVFMETGLNFTGGTNGDFYGTIFAPSGGVVFGALGTLTGAIYSGGSVTIGANHTLTYAGSNYFNSAGSTVIPEPSTFLLLGLGFLGLFLRRK